MKDGKKVILHSATGLDFQVPLLKRLAMDEGWKSPDAMVAMSKVTKHQESLECYACHASWVPQCYGCHVQVNYGKDKDGKPYEDTDWIAGGSERFDDGQTAESPWAPTATNGRARCSRSAPTCAGRSRCSASTAKAA